jgi:hypothetical protein
MTEGRHEEFQGFKEFKKFKEYGKRETNKKLWEL